MRRLALIVCLLIGTVAAHAQFEKGKWFVNPSVTGLNFSYNTETDKAHFGLEVKGGAFLIDNVALLLLFQQALLCRLLCCFGFLPGMLPLKKTPVSAKTLHIAADCPPGFLFHQSHKIARFPEAFL